MSESVRPDGKPGRGFPADQDTSPLFDHSQCVPAPWSHRTHLHEGVTGAWLFPDEVKTS